MPHQFRGVIPVLPTAFGPDGGLDHPSFSKVLDHVVDLQVPAVMFPGFASEYYKLDEAEKSLLGRHVIERTRGTDTRAILAVQGHATTLAIREAQTWVDMGVDGLNLLPPHYMSPDTDAVMEHCSTVLGAVPETPVLVQIAPGGPAPITPGMIRELASAHPNLAAVKIESRPPYGFISALTGDAESIACFAGSGGLFMVDSLDCGAVGVQPGSGFVEVYQLIHRAWSAGDLDHAGSLFGRLLRYLVGWATDQERMVAIEKLILQRRGLISDATCRAPHRALSPVEVASVDRFMDEFSDELAGDR